MLKILIFLLLSILIRPDTAIVTYHLYKSTDLLTTVACSDGANGIMSWGYKNISRMFPYVTAWQSLQWNSALCGSCIRIQYKGRFIYVTGIDKCGVINPLFSHFDLSRQAFTMIFGQEGIDKGTMTANFTLVSPRLCKGNRKRTVADTYVHLEQN